MDSTQKAVKNQEICEPLQGNLGITQSSGLDRHAVYARQRVDEFKDDDIASTQSARQSKDATDLVMERIVSTRSSSADSPHWNVSACKGFWMTGQISPARRTRQDIARWAILLPSRVWSSLCEA